ncbi:dihydrodipicolinate synthase family protein [Tropicimonas sp. IMCC34011]|uniref:dihydrodipicolinate synthase family protein n=1 Tax=Tropicimonas sp. IMCC34011 TaxID=2248759 RepID=UPI000E27F626|nr:dihydrodipicolinate synthase family protein [Tropicimonas sp. IMCC34011]
MTRLLTKDDVVGIFPPVISPFNENEELDLDAFRKEIRYNLELGVTGVCIGGSTGEGHALVAEEIADMVAAAQEELAGKIPVMAGIITTSSREAVKRAKAARDAGAQAVMVTPPIYQICSDDGVFDYYSRIHGESGMPIVVYNVLVNAGVTPALMQRMSDNLEQTGLIGTKESIGGSLETLTELLETIGDRISVTWAHDWLLYPGLALGARGSISGAAAILPQHCLVMWDAIQRSDIATAQKMHFAVTDVCSQISRYNWPAGIKACFNLQGRQVGPCRAPFHRVPDEQVERIRAALKRADAALADVSGD